MGQTKSKLEKICAEDIMTETVEVVKEEMTIGQVSHLLLRHRISGCPVVNEAGDPTGIITVTDLFILLDKIFKSDTQNAQEKLTKYKDQPISTIMSTNIQSISPKTTVSEIIARVVDEHIHTFPVIDGKKIVGIIGRHDVLNATFVYG